MIPVQRYFYLLNLSRLLATFAQESSFEDATQWAAFVDDKEQCAFRVCVGSKVLLYVESIMAVVAPGKQFLEIYPLCSMRQGGSSSSRTQW